MMVLVQADIFFHVFELLLYFSSFLDFVDFLKEQFGVETWKYRLRWLEDYFARIGT